MNVREFFYCFIDAGDNKEEVEDAFDAGDNEEADEDAYDASPENDAKPGNELKIVITLACYQ